MPTDRGGYVLRRSSVEGILKAVAFPDNPHTSSTTSECSLDDDGVAVFVDKLFGLAQLGDRARGTRHHRHVLLLGQCTGRNFVTEAIDDFGRGANKDYSICFDLASKFGVFRKEPVACNVLGDQPQI